VETEKKKRKKKKIQVKENVRKMKQEKDPKIVKSKVYRVGRFQASEQNYCPLSSPLLSFPFFSNSKTLSITKQSLNMGLEKIFDTSGAKTLTEIEEALH